MCSKLDKLEAVSTVHMLYLKKKTDYSSYRMSNRQKVQSGPKSTTLQVIKLSYSIVLNLANESSFIRQIRVSIKH